MAPRLRRRLAPFLQAHAHSSPAAEGGAAALGLALSGAAASGGSASLDDPAYLRSELLKARLPERHHALT